MREKTFSF